MSLPAWQAGTVGVLSRSALTFTTMPCEPPLTVLQGKYRCRDSRFLTTSIVSPHLLGQITGSSIPINLRQKYEISGPFSVVSSPGRVLREDPRRAGAGTGHPVPADRSVPLGAFSFTRDVDHSLLMRLCYGSGTARRGGRYSSSNIGSGRV